MHSSVHATENLLFITLAQLIVMILAARAGNQISRRLGQPGVIGEIMAGLLLGPSLFGHFFPDASTFLFGAKPSTPIVIISQIGLVLLMFQIGMDFMSSAISPASVIATACASEYRGDGQLGSALLPFSACGLGTVCRPHHCADPGAQHGSFHLWLVS